MNVIYVLRMYLGASQAKLAKMAGITQPDLSEMETRAFLKSRHSWTISTR